MDSSENKCGAIQNPWHGQMPLRVAAAFALRQEGVRVLEEPGAFLGIMLDRLDPNTAQARVLAHNCDEEFLDIFVAATQAHEPQELEYAATKACHLLAHDRMVQHDVADRVACEITFALAYYLRLECPDRVRLTAVQGVQAAEPPQEDCSPADGELGERNVRPQNDGQRGEEQELADAFPNDEDNALLREGEQQPARTVSAKRKLASVLICCLGGGACVGLAILGIVAYCYASMLKLPNGVANMHIFVTAYNIAGFLVIVTAHIGLVEQRRWEFWLHVVGLLGGLAFPSIVPYANEWFLGTQSTSEVLPVTLMLLQCFWAVLLAVFAISAAYDKKVTM